MLANIEKLINNRPYEFGLPSYSFKLMIHSLSQTISFKHARIA